MRFFVKLALSVFLMDRITKGIVKANFSEGQSIPLIENIFHLTYVRNPGAAFSLFPHKTLFFIVVTIAVLVVILYYYNKIPADRLRARTALALQFGGAAGNLVDRIFGGYVVDFFDFRVFPVFNIADSGVIEDLLSWEIITWPRKMIRAGVLRW